MARPTRVRIGYLTFTIQWISEEDWATKDVGRVGITHPEQETIRMRLGNANGPYSETNLREVLLHEILHGIFYSTALSAHPRSLRDKDQEEYVVANMSPMLLTVIRANPSLLKYLSGV